MENRCLIRDHLRDGAVYLPDGKMAVSESWKQNLLARYAPPKPRLVLPRDEQSTWIYITAIALPVLSVAAALAVFFGVIHPASLPADISSAIEFTLPVFGIKESLVFAAIVTVLTYVVSGRLSDLL